MPNPLMSQEEVQKRIESELSLPTEDRSKYRRTAVKHMLDKAYNKRKQQQELDKKQQEAAARGQSYIGSPSMPQDVKDRVFGTVEENKAQDKIKDYNYTASLSWLPTASNPNISKESRGFMYGVDRDNIGNYVIAGLFPQLNNLSFPYQAAMAVHPAYNLVSEDGVKKTVREFSNGNIGAGTLSLAGDLVDASIAAPAAKTAVGGLMFGLGKYGRGSVQNFGRAYTVNNEMNNTLGQGIMPTLSILGDRTEAGVYRFTQPDGTIRLRLPEHTAEKPREIKIDPKDGQGHNVHIRTWDDAVNHVPASNMSKEDKQILYEGLKHEIPEGTIINIPKSGPDNYATRGTIAGLKYFEKDPVWTPGSQHGLVFFKDKNGQIGSYFTSNFIKDAESKLYPNLVENAETTIKEFSPFIPKERGLFGINYQARGSAFRPQFERLWGKKYADKLTDEQLGKLSEIRHYINNTNKPAGDFVSSDGHNFTAFRDGEQIGTLITADIANGKIRFPQMIQKNGINNSRSSELLMNAALVDKPYQTGTHYLMPEVTTHIVSKYPNKVLVSNGGLHEWPIKTAADRGITLDYAKGWPTMSEFAKQLKEAFTNNMRMSLKGQPIFNLMEGTYKPVVKHDYLFDANQLRNGFINLDLTPGYLYKKGGKLL